MKTLSEIRDELKVTVRFNAKGEWLQRGYQPSLSPSDDGGLFNGYVTIPNKYVDYFKYDREYNEYTNIPEDVHGGCIYAEPLKNGSLQVGFDTLHAGDKEDYWTKKRTLEEAHNWADKIADKIFRMLPADETTPTATVQQLIEFLGKFDPSAPVYFLREFNETMPVTPDSVCQGNRDVIYLCNEVYSDEE